jgi:sulfur relay (sulfurtransferase) DsrC/TusE family protein
MSEDKEIHYLLSPNEDESTNEFLYKLNQAPVNWIYKGTRIRRDAEVFYKYSEESRTSIIQYLKDENFNFKRFYRWELQGHISKFLDMHPARTLPDFDTYYLLINLAFENFLKGLWLAKHVEKMGFKVLPKEIDTHNTAQLAKTLQISLSDEEMELLEGLYDQFQGYGRYPIKKKVKPEINIRDIDFGERNFDSVCIDCVENPYQYDRETLDSIYNVHLKPLIATAFAQQHQHMEAMFKFKKSDLDEE